jgi:PIN domain nuclease of toxin-antitoxin system
VSTSSSSVLLPDTHALLCWLAELGHLSPAAHAAFADPQNRVDVSAASGWEIATKVRLGKLAAPSDRLADLPQLLADQGPQQVSITLKAFLCRSLYLRHKFNSLCSLPMQWYWTIPKYITHS